MYRACREGGNVGNEAFWEKTPPSPHKLIQNKGIRLGQKQMERVLAGTAEIISWLWPFPETLRKRNKCYVIKILGKRWCLSVRTALLLLFQNRTETDKVVLRTELAYFGAKKVTTSGELIMGNAVPWAETLAFVGWHYSGFYRTPLALPSWTP